MRTAQEIIGACVKAIRDTKGQTQESLACKSGITYQYLSGLENGRENFTIQVIERIAGALGFPLKSLVSQAYDTDAKIEVPKIDDGNFRANTPLPEGLTIRHLEDALNQTQAMLHMINRSMTLEVGRSLNAFIQGNNFSGLVSNIFSDAMDKNSPYKHNHHQRYPDLINHLADCGRGVGLEVKATINVGKGGESHNGHSGWHTVVCYEITDWGIQFVHVMFALLNGHRDADPDWNYVGSKENADTGSRRTETYVTGLRGTTKLRDGSVYLDPAKVNFRRWRQERDGSPPAWSIFSSVGG
jgi:transcriptional regulator with XRE-family HTH domain